MTLTIEPIDTEEIPLKPAQVHNDARNAHMCGCGIGKKKGFSFCLACFKSLPSELQIGLTTPGNIVMRDQSYFEAVKALEPRWYTRKAARDGRNRAIVELTESQMVMIFQGADMNGKRIAIQALLDQEAS